MVEYSNAPASESEMSAAYTDTGYEAAFKHPQDSADEVINSGITAESVTKLRDANERVQATSLALKKKKILKKLFLQYIRKYIANPKKYIDHPKQIRNLPSWFDDAIVLFGEDEITREQKRMIREFFYGLIQYRDQKIASGESGMDIATETNRQLGERSPYQYSEENPDDVSFPRQNEMQQLDVMSIARNVANQNIKEAQQPTMEEYVESEPDQLPMVTYISNKDKANVGGMLITRPIQSAFSLDNFIRPIGTRLQQPTGQPSSVQPLVKPIDQPSIQTTQVPLGNNDNIDLTSFLIGSRGRSLVSRPQPVQPTMVEPTPVQYRKIKKGNKVKPKLNRKLPKMSMDMIPNIPKGLSLKGIMGKTSIELKPINITANKPIAIKKKSLNIKSKVTVSSQQIMKPVKSMGALGTIRSMDKMFNQIKSHSKNNYTPSNMKMKVISDIKDQCDKAFKRNQFRVESTNMKNNYFRDVKNSLPDIKMEMDGMGDIHEKNVMRQSIMGVPKAININNTTPFVVKRGSMRPKSVGITEYDFDLGNIYKKKKKSIPTLEEEYFYDEE